MELTFIGHQSWMVSVGNSHLLIDPIMESSFGYQSIKRIEIYPPRNCEMALMPKISAVFLSHEHSDHFHLPTLSQLDKDVPVYVSPIMIQPVVDIIRKLGLKVIRVPPNEPVTIGNLIFIPYIASHETVLWESRVTQIYFLEKGIQESAVFIAVDALLSEKFIEDVNSEKIAYPTILAVSNNAQITPKGVFGSLDNLLTEDSDLKNGPFGLQILYELLVTYTNKVNKIKNIIICGGGFMKGYEGLGPFPFSDQAVLADIAQQLTSDINIYGPLPGEKYVINENGVEKQTANWITLNEIRLIELKKQRDDFISTRSMITMSSLMAPFDCENEEKLALKRVQKELDGLSLPLMLSPLGIEATNIRYYLLGPLDAKRIIIQLIGKNDRIYQYALDFKKAKFEVVDTSIDMVSKTYPYGIIVYLRDFDACIRGELQIWDLAGIALRSWYVGDKMSSPVAFLYSYYGEQVHPELAEKCYVRQFNQIQSISKCLSC